MFSFSLTCTRLFAQSGQMRMRIGDDPGQGRIEAIVRHGVRVPVAPAAAGFLVGATGDHPGQAARGGGDAATAVGSMTSTMPTQTPAAHDRNGQSDVRFGHRSVPEVSGSSGDADDAEPAGVRYALAVGRDGLTFAQLLAGTGLTEAQVVLPTTRSTRMPSLS